MLLAEVKFRTNSAAATPIRTNSAAVKSRNFHLIAKLPIITYVSKIKRHFIQFKPLRCT